MTHHDHIQPDGAIEIDPDSEGGRREIEIRSLANVFTLEGTLYRTLAEQAARVGLKEQDIPALKSLAVDRAILLTTDNIHFAQGVEDDRGMYSLTLSRNSLGMEMHPDICEYLEELHTKGMSDDEILSVLEDTREALVDSIMDR